MNELYLILKKYYGENAQFRDGQKEAIEDVLQGKRTLVVQKTGWGKSLVYFMATRIIRKRSVGITLIISPLLALMNNQIESATKLELQVRSINSENQEEWEGILDEINRNCVDALIISPERLANAEFKELLMKRLSVQIGLLVVDEAHCISDWGHDFRPDYRRIVDIINVLPSNVPVLATTATANNRVVEDIKDQLGGNLQISRGSLMRDSLAIQVIRLDSKEERLAWLADNISLLSGTGIIYCLTVSDCKLVSQWLNSKGICCNSYYAGMDQEEKREAVERFMNDEIKALVATVAFGMGFDKPDIAFVIHFQKPGNVVAYYQQIGRAGRAIEQAYAVLFCGREDDEINNYFIDSAFPTEDLMNDVVKTVTEHPGTKKMDFEQYINMKRRKIDQCIKYLLVNGDIYKEGKAYYKTPRVWKADLKKSNQITNIRRLELKQINDFANTPGCYMKYIANVLDDTNAKECRKCSNCLGTAIFPEKPSLPNVIDAQRFIKEAFYIIEPRKKWPNGIRIEEKNNILIESQCEQGLVLSNYGDAGWGKLVAECKYEKGYFDEQLLNASVELLQDYVKDNDIKWVTNISSRRRPDLVRNFAKKLASCMKLEYRDVIEKKSDARCQKELNTNYLQFQNAYDSFEVVEALPENVLLVDDMVDSRWTFTVCGYMLRKKGSGKVFPYALANTAGRNGDE